MMAIAMRASARRTCGVPRRALGRWRGFVQDGGPWRSAGSGIALDVARTPRSPCEDDKQENKGGNDDTERSSVLLAALILTVAHMTLPSDIEKNAAVCMMVPDLSPANRSIGPSEHSRGAGILRARVFLAASSAHILEIPAGGFCSLPHLCRLSPDPEEIVP